MTAEVAATENALNLVELLLLNRLMCPMGSPPKRSLAAPHPSATDPCVTDRVSSK